MNAPLPLVAIGGTLCDERIWSFLADQEECLTLVAGTLPDGQPTDASDMKSYVGTLLANLPPRFLLAGFSLGGLIALEMIAQAPERIAGLALICAGAGDETPDGERMRRSDEGRALSAGMPSHASGDIWPRFGAQDATDSAAFIEMAQAVGPELYRIQNDLAISRADSLPRLANIDGPVLLVSGAQDPLCPPARHEQMAVEIPQAERVVIEGAGHMICFDQPARLNDVLANWITDTRTAAQQGAFPEATAAKRRVAS